MNRRGNQRRTGGFPKEPMGERRGHLRPAIGPIEWTHMKDKNSKKKRKTPRRVSPVLRVGSGSGDDPDDAEDRMRRLLALMVKYATQDGYFTSGEDAPSDGPSGEEHAQEEG